MKFISAVIYVFLTRHVCTHVCRVYSPVCGIDKRALVALYRLIRKHTRRWFCGSVAECREPSCVLATGILARTRVLHCCAAGCACPDYCRWTNDMQVKFFFSCSCFPGGKVEIWGEWKNRLFTRVEKVAPRDWLQHSRRPCGMWEGKSLKSRPITQLARNPIDNVSLSFPFNFKFC